MSTFRNRDATIRTRLPVLSTRTTIAAFLSRAGGYPLGRTVLQRRRTINDWRLSAQRQPEVGHAEQDHCHSLKHGIT